MIEQELRQVAVDNYITLLRIKAAEKAENEELDTQLEIAKLRLAPYNVDTSELEKRIFKN